MRHIEKVGNLTYQVARFDIVGWVSITSTCFRKI